MSSKSAVVTAMAVALCIGFAGSARAAELILNEYNAVGSADFLNLGTAGMDGEGNTTNLASDSFFGRIAGNGGDWFELVVVADHLDIRGWSLVICDVTGCNDQLDFASHPVWSDLRAGTIITVAEDEPTDLSFDPNTGDWWMNVQATNGGPGTYITADNFPVNNDDWQLMIRNGAQTIFGPAGEHVPIDPNAGCFPPIDNVNSGEIFRLEQAPTALVDPCIVTQNDWEDGVLSTFGSPNVWNSGTAVQDLSKLRTLAPIPDLDGDQIADDGSLSGLVGDARCTGGATTNCDDNCRGIQNPTQSDVGGVSGPDGIGDTCQCGDPTADATVTSADVDSLRDWLAGNLTALPARNRCSVRTDGACNVADLVALRRGLASLAPGLAQTCAAAAVPTDQTEFLFLPDRLLEIEVRLDLADWNVLRFQKNDIFALLGSPTCGDAPWNDPYTFFPAEVIVDGQTLENVGVRKKGFQGSLSDTTPSLKVKFDHFVGGQQLNDLDRLTLNNNLQDPAQVKQCLSYLVMRKSGLPAPRCNFAHVVVTTLDGGAEATAVDRLYTHIDSIKDPFLRRNFGSDMGRLYEGTLSDFWPGSFRGTIEPKSPEAAADTSEIDALVTALNDGGLSDAQRLLAIEALVDVDAFLTFWAAEGLVGHWDGYADDQNNFWFYVDPSDGLIRFIPWGTDDTFGRGNFLRGGLPTHSAAIVPRAALPRRLYEIASTRADFLARLQTLLDDVFDEAELQAEVDRIEALISPIAGDLTAQLAPIRTWIDAHRALVQAELNAPPIGFLDQPDHFCFFNP